MAYVSAGKTIRTLREFVERAFAQAGIEIEWQGIGVEEKGINRATGQVVVAVDQQFFRPTEVNLLLGNPVKGKEKLGLVLKTSFDQLVKILV